MSKYYYLIMKEDFFENSILEWLEDQNKEYVLFYIKLCLKSLRDGGILIRHVSEELTVPYDNKKLSALTNTDEKVVDEAMELLVKLKLVMINEDGGIVVNGIKDYIGAKGINLKKRVKSLDKTEPTELERLEGNFQKLYDIYPKKRGKTRAFQLYQGWLKGRKINGKEIKMTNNEMYMCIKNYIRKQEKSNTDIMYYKNFDTLMNQLLDWHGEKNV